MARRWGRLAAVVAVVVMAACDASDERDGPPAADAPATSATSGPTTAPSPTGTPPSAGPAVTVAPYVVAGWWDGQRWVAADGKRPVPVSGGETYSILGLTGPVTTGTGAKAGEGCETDPGTSTIRIAGLERDGPAPRPIAVTGVADPRPRPTTVLDPATPVYRQAAARVLAERGIDDLDADVVQALRTDLEGDGKDEVIVVAERIADPDLYAKAGDYSFVLLRRVAHDGVQTTVVAQSVPDLTANTTPFIYSHRVSAIADLNGDDRMELVVELRQYEGIGVSVHELRPDGAMPVVMDSDCGA